MSLYANHTAVLLFSLPAHLDAVRKGVAGRDAKRNTALWKSMEQLTMAKAHAAGLPCLRSTEMELVDVSTSFGEQMRMAIAAALASGYERVIVIGNDCPDLRVNDLRQAAQALEQGQLPVGYDQRGGIFLLGLDRRFLTSDCQLAFSTLPWQTAQLGESLTDFLNREFGSVIGLLATRADWNCPADVRPGTWMSGAFAWMALRIWALLGLSSVSNLRQPSFFCATNGRISGLRAPPGLV